MEAADDEIVAHRERGGLVRAKVVKVVRRACEGGLHVSDDGLGDLRDI